MRYIIHILVLMIVKLPLQLIGIVILPFVTYKYQLGSFPKYLRWFDDVRGIRVKEGYNCRKFFGAGHCWMFKAANSKWWTRYIWCAFRNAVNYFQHFVIGRGQYDRDAWQVFRYVDIPKTNYQLRIRIGYKVERDKVHKKNMYTLDIPAQWVFSISPRRKK